ncbi:exopolysaccharide biosynthesis protein [Caulobacter mirabilis]|uniref:non-specific protein-tyrosine kinase n=1 Tax=Caulobacter mirabilis TaxID=69666 RepID=A0A2D2ASY5_9CAUL|nr:exopolysaccharide biosynthesis protein [Caulobacter mirabilis]
MLGKDNDARPISLRDQRAPVIVGAAPVPWTAMEETAEPAFNLVEYWRMLLKHRVLIAVIFVAALVVGVAATLLMTPIYTADATLQIDREAAKVVEGDVSPQETSTLGMEFFQTQYGLLESRMLAERVADNLGLNSSNAFLEQMNVDPREEGSTDAERRAKRKEQVVQVLQDNLVIKPVTGSRLVHVVFSSPDPALSAKISNAFAENFIKANLDRRFESSAYARDFLEDRIAQVKARLEETERQLVAYAAEQQIINLTEPDEKTGAAQSLVATDLASMNQALAQATAARVSAEAKWRQASTAAVMTLPEVLQNPAVQQIAQDRARLNAEYQQKLRVYKPDFPEMQQLKAQLSELDAQQNAIAGDIRASLRARYSAALAEEQSLRGRVGGLKQDVLSLRSRSVQYNILQRELDTSRTLYDGLLQRYKEIGVAGGVAANNISLVDRAEPPSRPSKPSIPLNILVSAIVGLGLGVLMAFIREALDESLSTPEDVEAKLGVPVLGAIPLLEKGVRPAAALDEIRSSFAEAYYSLRTALQFSTPDGVPSTLLITSAKPSEGKSTTALAVARSLARVGGSVLLIDSDLRNPSMHQVLAAENSKGLSNILAGGASLQAVVQPTSEPNLSFVACGPLPPNPAELLSGNRVSLLLEEACRHFDTVVIDGPPVLGLSDAPLLASQVGGTLFVLEAGGTRRGQARGALKRLRMGQARLLGIVLTKFNMKTTSYGYSYSYDYTYGSTGSQGSLQTSRRSA